MGLISTFPHIPDDAASDQEVRAIIEEVLGGTLPEHDSSTYIELLNAINSKQDKLTGEPGQVICIDENRAASAKDFVAPAYTPIVRKVVLAVNNWTQLDEMYSPYKYGQSAFVEGVTSDESKQTVLVRPDFSSTLAYINADIMFAPVPDENNAIMFGAVNKPDADLTIYATILDAKNGGG